jgi:hypothetical protein
MVARCAMDISAGRVESPAWKCSWCDSHHARIAGAQKLWPSHSQVGKYSRVLTTAVAIWLFGVDDASRAPMGETTLYRALFSQDTIAGIVRKYLDPRVAVRMQAAEHGGVSYPVLIVPGLSARPVVAVADGPQDGTGRRVGIRLGEIYIRAAGPQSIPIRSPRRLERSAGEVPDAAGRPPWQGAAADHRRPGRLRAQAIELQRATMEATRVDFKAQVEEIAPQAGSADQARVRLAGSAFSVLSYAFLGKDGELLELESLPAP